MVASIKLYSGEEAYLICADHLASLNDHGITKQYMLRSARVWIGEDNAELLAVWGLISPTLLSDRAYLWLYHTPAMLEHTFMLIRHSQRVIGSMLEIYSAIDGHCLIDAPKSIRWVRWLGAEFGEPSGMLIPFTIRSKQWPTRQQSAR